MGEWNSRPDQGGWCCSLKVPVLTLGLAAKVSSACVLGETCPFWKIQLEYQLSNSILREAWPFFSREVWVLQHRRRGELGSSSTKIGVAIASAETNVGRGL